MQKVYFAVEPDEVIYVPQEDGSANVRLRRNIRQEKAEEGPVWTAEEVSFNTCLTETEIRKQAERYFVEESETTIADLVEALDILTGIVIGEEDQA